MKGRSLVPGPRFVFVIQFSISLIAVFLSHSLYCASSIPGTVLPEEEKRAESIAAVPKLTDEGLRHQNARQFEAAIEKYKAALVVTQNIQTSRVITAALFGLLSSAYVHLGRWSEAAEASNQAIRTNPDDAVAYQLLGLAYNELHRYQEAEEVYKEAIRINSKYVEAYHGLGLVYKNLHHYKEAAEAFEEAIRLKPDFALSRLELGLTFNKIAVDLSQQGNYPEAARFGERVLEISKETRGPDHLDTAAAFNNLALLYERMGQYAKALPLYQRALVIDEKTLGPDHPTTVTVLSNLAEVYCKIGNYTEAIRLGGQALAIKEKTLGSDHLDTAISLTNLAEVYRNMGEYAKALPLSRRALAIFEKVLGPDHPHTATSLNNLAGLYYNTGDYEKALSLSQQVLKIRENALGPEHPDTVLSLNNLAVLYGSIGEYAKALQLCEQALEIREKVLGPNHPDTVASLNELAELHRKRGDYARALLLHQRALAIREKVLGPNHPDTITSLNNMTVLYEDMGDSDKALSLAQQVLASREKVLGPDHPDTITSLNNLAALYNELKDYTEALPLHERALAIREKALGPNHPDTALSLNNLAESYGGIGEYDKALPLLQRALAIDEKVLGPDHPSTALALNNLALLHDSRGEYDKALPLLQRALAIDEKVLGPDHPSTISPLDNLAVAYQSRGNYTKALQFFQRGLIVEDRTFANVFSVASEEQKLSFVQKSQGSYWGTLSLIHRHFQKDSQVVRFGLELVLRRKGIVLDAQSRAQQALVANLTGETLETWQRLTEHRSALSRLLLNEPEKQNPAHYKQRIEGLQAAIAREEEFLAQHSGLVAQELAQRQVTAQMLAGRLPGDSALVEFVRIRDWDEEKKKWSDAERYLAFILTADNQVALVDLGAAQKIDTKVKITLAAINQPDYSRDPETYSHQADVELTELYALIFQPLETVLSSRVQLIVSPDGELNNVPFAALRTQDGQYLVEKTTLSYVASGRDLLRGKSGVDPTVALLLVANPAFDDGKVLQMAAASSEEAMRAADYRKSFPPLPGTAEEAQVILPLVKGTQKVLEGEQATESTVRTTKSPKVLHLAIHGFFLKDEDLPLPDPMPRFGNDHLARTQVSPMVRSGLALAGANHAREITAGDDGLLTALEVTSMNLYGTDLVVLSACETAAGDVKVGEGVYGLRRAFVLAGAKNLVMSLWQVGDQTTHTQMEEFYRTHEQGEQPAEALRRAQLQTIAHLRELTAGFGKPFAPVRLWAPFILQQTGQ